MVEDAIQTRRVLRYAVFEWSAFGTFRAAAEVEAKSDKEALREAAA